MKRIFDPHVRWPRTAVSFPSKAQDCAPEAKPDETTDEMTTESMTVSMPIAATASAEVPRAVDMSEDVALFRAFLGGDDVAAITVFRKFHRRLFVYCTKVLGSAEQAEDVVGEVWERVVKLRSNPPEVHSPIGFLLKVARNLCLNHIRSRREHVSLANVAESDHPAHAPDSRSELEERLIGALETLPFETREILVLNAYCGYRFDEIATMLEKTPEAVWARASRARAQLRRMVLDGSNDGGRE
jgi:RNA polymerase sigma-70 factor (ECF subfamily)